MKNKICPNCREYKRLSDFHKDKYTKSGYTSFCKKCRNSYTNNYKSKRQLKEPWWNSYRGAKERCGNPNNVSYHNYGGRGIQFNLTMRDIEQLWKRDNASHLKRPSIDRIDNDGHYCLENCRFIELGDNIKKQDISKKYKPILQYDLDGNFIREWDYTRQARGYYGNGVKDCLRGRCKTAYGFKWEYKQ